MTVNWGKSKKLSQSEIENESAKISKMSLRFPKVESGRTRRAKKAYFNSIWVDDTEYHLGQCVAISVKGKRSSSIAMIHELSQSKETDKTIKVRLMLSYSYLDQKATRDIEVSKNELFYSNVVKYIDSDDILHHVDVMSKENYEAYTLSLKPVGRTRNSKGNAFVADKYFCSFYYDYNIQQLGRINWSQCCYTKNGESLSKLIEPSYDSELFKKEKEPKESLGKAEYAKITRRMKRLSISKNSTPKKPAETKKKQAHRHAKENLSLVYINDYEKLSLGKIPKKKPNNKPFVLIEPINPKIKERYSLKNKNFIDVQNYLSSDSESESDGYNSESTSGFDSDDSFTANNFQYISESSDPDYDSDFVVSKTKSKSRLKVNTRSGLGNRPRKSQKPPLGNKYINQFNNLKSQKSLAYLDVRLPTRGPLTESTSDISISSIPASKVSERHTSEFSNAISNLHVSSTPDSLPCRENECMDIFSEIYEALETKTSCCLYISGVPGTGKTATVMEVLRMISFASDQGDLPNFDFISINGMKITEPQQLYVKLWQGITKSNAKITANHAASNLDEYFGKGKEPSGLSSREGADKMVVVFVDELDVLLTKSQSIIYNLFDWPSRPKSNLVVITVANTMDLPERMLHHKISSRLGLKRINFLPYSHEQLTQIVLSRIGESSVFDPDAVQLCARKISAVSGDARRVLDACRRAVEIVESDWLSTKANDQMYSNNKASGNSKEPRGSKVTIKIIEQVVREMYSYGFIPTIQNASISQKIFLLSVRAALRMCGLQETVLGEVVRFHHQFTKMFGLEALNNSQITKIAFDLAATGCILIESGGNLGPHRMVKLNIGEDEIVVALRPDPMLGKSV